MDRTAQGEHEVSVSNDWKRSRWQSDDEVLTIMQQLEHRIQWTQRLDHRVSKVHPNSNFWICNFFFAPKFKADVWRIFIKNLGIFGQNSHFTHIVYIDWDVGSKAHCIIILWCTIIPIGMVAATSWKFRSSANGLYLVVLPLLYLYFWVEVDSTLSVRSAV